MRSRPARLVLSALAWIALSGAALFTVQQQQQIDDRHAALRAFEATARDAADALDDLRAGQQAYVAAGQEAAVWLPRVANNLQTAATSVDTLRSAALSGTAGPALLDASTTVTQIANIDRVVRQRLTSDQMTAAAESVFGEGADAIAKAVSNVDAAVSSEQQAAETFDAARRRAQVYALGGAAGFTAIVLAILGFATPALQAQAGEPSNASEVTADAAAPQARERLQEPAPSPQPQSGAPPASELALRSLAGLCTEFGRVRDAEQLNELVHQAAALIDARGVIVWLGTSAGGDLRPVLAHGYTNATLSHLSTVPRSADNAAAAAYRTGELQIVPSRAGGAAGAVVAPLLSNDGCIGAFTAELRHGGEQMESTRALAQILASQLAGVLAAAATAQSEQPQEARSAAG